MTDETRTLARYRLQRAREALNEAELLLGQGHTNTYVSPWFDEAQEFVDELSKEAENRMKRED